MKTLSLSSPRLTPQAYEVLTASLAWMDQQWDDSASMLSFPSDWADSYSKVLHHVRETGFYALALLLRGDLERAVRAIEAVLEYQMDAPGEPFHGTWLCHIESPVPGAGAREWADYDPNWREFIGSTLALILFHFERDLPSALVVRIDTALRRACAGAVRRNVPADYTNIALMSAFLLDFAGTRFRQPGWVAWGEKLAGGTRALFAVHGTFPEYNSPTYYGVDLYALALWRGYAPCAKLRSWGNEMEHALWRDIAQYYHADMRNIAGPFDRAYGMDMRRYAAVAGTWVWLHTGRALAPYPDTTKPFAHAHDFAFAPLIAVVGANIPADAAEHLSTFAGARGVIRQISEKRTATAWLEERLMLGGEWTDGDLRVWDQFHPGTVHWRAGDDVHWMRIETFTAVNVRVEQTRMSISVPAQAGTAASMAFRWLIHSPGAEARATFSPTSWVLPGLRVRIESEQIAASNPANSGDLLAIACSLPAGKPGAMSMVFEVI